MGGAKSSVSETFRGGLDYDITMSPSIIDLLLCHSILAYARRVTRSIVLQSSFNAKFSKQEFK